MSAGKNDNKRGAGSILKATHKSKAPKACADCYLMTRSVRLSNTNVVYVANICRATGEEIFNVIERQRADFCPRDKKEMGIKNDQSNTRI